MSEEQRDQLANEYWKWFSKGTELYKTPQLKLIKNNILRTPELKTLFQKISDYWGIGNVTRSNYLEQTIKKLILLEDNTKTPFELMKDLKDNIVMNNAEKSSVYLKETKYNEFRGSNFIRKELFNYFSTCPYCNFNYLSKLEEKEVGGENKDYYDLEVDHYYPKADYPYLAISIFNLVPSCPTCNGIKNNNNNQHLHPYTEEMGDNAKFTLSMSCLGELTGIEFENMKEYKELESDLGTYVSLNFNLEEEFSKRVELKIKDGLDSDFKDRIENSKEIFQLENKYSGVREEIRDLYFKHKLFSPSQREETLSQFGDSLGITLEQMEEVYFGARKENPHKRPLSKFINDIRDFLDNEDQDDFE